jgi:hypothetical protein
MQHCNAIRNRHGTGTDEPCETDLQLYNKFSVEGLTAKTQT